MIFVMRSQVLLNGCENPLTEFICFKWHLNNLELNGRLIRDNLSDIEECLATMKLLLQSLQL